MTAAADVPVLKVPGLSGVAGFRTPLADRAWRDVPELGLVRNLDGSTPRWPTSVRVAHGGGDLLVRFECRDDDVWSRYTERDDPLWEEEVVEVFLAPGEADPAVYWEFEINPLGALFDARISNPSSSRADLKADAAWNSVGIRWAAGSSATGWWAEIAVPLRELAAGQAPAAWRGNFHRIERPRGFPPEFSSWSPTRTDPADFHKPGRFGRLVLR